MVSSAEQWVTGDVVTVLAGKQSHPVFMVDHLVEPRAFAQSVRHVSGEALLLLE